MGADNPGDLALDVDGVDDDRIHARVGGLETDAAALAVDALEGGGAVFEQRDHRLTVVGELLPVDDDQIAVEDVVFDHAVALDAQDELLAGATHVVGQVDGFLVIFDGQDGLAGGDGADQRGAAVAAEEGGIRIGLEDLDAEGEAGTGDGALALKGVEMLLDGGGGQPEAIADLPHAGTVFVFVEQVADGGDDGALPAGNQVGHGRSPGWTALPGNYQTPTERSIFAWIGWVGAGRFWPQSGRAPATPTDPTGRLVGDQAARLPGPMKSRSSSRSKWTFISSPMILSASKARMASLYTRFGSEGVEGVGDGDYAAENRGMLSPSNPCG